jgi:hypothetical protein
MEQNFKLHGIYRIRIGGYTARFGEGNSKMGQSIFHEE